MTKSAKEHNTVWFSYTQIEMRYAAGDQRRVLFQSWWQVVVSPSRKKWFLLPSSSIHCLSHIGFSLENSNATGGTRLFMLLWIISVHGQLHIAPVVLVLWHLILHLFDFCAVVPCYIYSIVADSWALESFLTLSNKHNVVKNLLIILISFTACA